MRARFTRDEIDVRVRVPQGENSGLPISPIAVLPIVPTFPF